MTDWTEIHADAAARDHADPLAAQRDLFHLPEGVIYLDGNSLGPAPKAVARVIARTIQEEWGTGLIRSWNQAGWFDLPLTYGDRLAPLIGAGPGEVAVCDTVSINIAKVLHAALGLRPGRGTIVAEGAGFHTDRYMAEGVVASRPGARLLLEGRDGALEDLVGSDTAAVLINHVDYRTGALRDMGAVTRTVQEAGALAIWDLCHSAGAMPVELNACGADMGVGCTYKYLNGGPGAPAFVFCAGRHLDRVTQPLSGWWAHAAPFDFEEGFRPAPGIARFLCGTQPILSFRALAPALEIFEQVDLEAVRTKSMALTQFFIETAEATCADLGVTLASPRDPAARGSQVALRHAHAYPVMQALIEAGVIGDFRAPDILRFGFAPLYTGFAEAVRAVEALQGILAAGTWRQTRFNERRKVT